MYPIDWKETFTGISTFLNALGSVATFGAFIYLFRKDKDKQAQIDRLTTIATELTKLKAMGNARLNLSVKPDFKFKSMTNGTDGTLDIRVINNGDRAVINKVELNSESLILYNLNIPIVIDTDSERKIFIRTKKATHINESEYDLELNFTDKIGNQYTTLLKGKGFKNKVINTYLSIPRTFE